MEQKPIIQFKNVEKYYGDFHVLKNINFEVYEGEVVVLIGPSGSGKSTLVRTINGLEEIQEGSLIVDGHDLRDKNVDIRQVRRDAGMVFQNFELYPHLTIQENITLAPIKVLKLSKEEADERAIQLLRRVGLEDQKDKYPSQLSGGQKQRVAIARGLAMRPKIMLFDEPTSALDPEMVKGVLDIMKKIAFEDHMTMVVVTHEMGFAKEVSHRTVFLADGEILEDKLSPDFFANPENERAKTFLDQIINK